MLILWLKFIVAAAIVIFCGYKICIYAEKIAQIINIGRSFVGLVLLATVTSLPELAVAISAAKIGALDLALGDLFGSNLFNLSILGLIFLIFIKQPRRLSFDSAHFISLGLSVLLVALAAMGMLFYNSINPGLNYSNIFLDVETFLILAIYLFGTYLIFCSGKGEIVHSPQINSSQQQQRLGIWLKFLIYSGILVGTAMYLSRLGNQIAQIPVGGVALGGTFVGSLFIALTTSLPEAAVAISAVKLGFLDIALGNIFGSNMFNMVIISITDLSLGSKVILSAVSSEHLFTVLFVIILSGIVMSSLIYRSKRQLPGLAWDSLSIIFVYFAANIVNFYLRQI